MFHVVEFELYANELKRWLLIGQISDWSPEVQAVSNEKAETAPLLYGHCGCAAVQKHCQRLHRQI